MTTLDQIGMLPPATDQADVVAATLKYCYTF